jgi:uncharacterized protein YdeI (YjbR/CyaY-like superfamily)
MMADMDRVILAFASADDWRDWLAAEHSTSAGIWIQVAKKKSGIASITYAEALNVALRYGWIDAQKESLDESYWLQRFCPRGPRSKWSKINVGHATALIEQGLMTPAGLAEVERAKADGRWAAAYASPSTITVPDDLRAALDAVPAAAAFFTTLTSQNRYAILYRIGDAKRPQTRARRIETFVAMLAEGKTLH